MSDKFESNVVGTSPLGGNGAEGTANHCAAVRNTSILKVPLFYDSRVGGYISEQAIDELNDRDVSLKKQQAFNREEQFRAKAGYERT